MPWGSNILRLIQIGLGTLYNSVRNIELKVVDIWAWRNAVSARLGSIDTRLANIEGYTRNVPAMLNTVSWFTRELGKMRALNAVKRRATNQVSQAGTHGTSPFTTVVVLRPLNAVNRVRLVDANGPIIYSAAGGCRPLWPCHVDTEDNALYLGAAEIMYIEPVQGQTVTVEEYSYQ